MSKANTYINNENYSNFVGSKTFEYIVISAILLAAIFTGIGTYDLSYGQRTLLEKAELTLTVWFVTEILLRVFSAKSKKVFFSNHWNTLDVIIIVLLLVPIENSDLAIFVRMVRIFRILRLLSIFPSLRKLISAMVKAVPQLSYVVVFMAMIFYIYAAIGTTFFSSINEFLWGDIGISMLTLFRVMTFEDWTDVMYETMKVYPSSFIYYISFISVTAFATLNLVIGIMTASLESEQIEESSQETSDEIDNILSNINILEAKIDSLSNALLEKENIKSSCHDK